MMNILFDGSESRISASLLAFGGYLVVTALVSSLRSRIHLSSPLVSMLVGILLGPAVFDVISLGEWTDGEEGVEAREAFSQFIKTVIG